MTPTCNYFDPSPENLLNPAAPGVDRPVPVDYQDGAGIRVLRESELVAHRGGHEDDNEVTRFVEYRLPHNPDLVVHRSAHVHLKKAVWGEALAAQVG